ncbi:MAG: methyltransferase [Bacteroidales bacterium]|nr:methyltransferase [Bacteroidales bacterium]
MAASFDFKQFSVINERSAQKVGTDAVLLGAWAGAPAGAARVLDAGTGTGVIALMMAQRCPQAQITGIDIDSPSVEEATLNFASSPWHDRLSAQLCRLQDWTGEVDMIISNPPFFINSLKAPDDRRAAARHTDSLTHRDIIAAALQCLSPHGSLAVIYPADEAQAFVGEALASGLFPVRICHVSTKASAAPKRFMMELSRTKKEPLIEELIMSDGPDYTEQYKALTRDFYLKF